jgi:poly-gamma-glutamate synthase PgsB/CapB
LESLPPLERRLKVRLAGELERWLELPASAEGQPGARGLARMDALMAACNRLEARRAEVEADFLTLNRALGQARHAGHVQELLLGFLARLEADPKRLAGDREAFRRQFGLDAVAERVRLHLVHLGRLQELAVQLAGAAAVEALREADDPAARGPRLASPSLLLPTVIARRDESTGDASLSSSLKPRASSLSAGEARAGSHPSAELARLEAFAVQRLRQDPRWQGTVAALKTLRDVALLTPAEQRLAHFAVSTVATVTALALDGDENVWVQREALELLYLLRPEDGLRAVERRLGLPRADVPDDLFVRKYAVELLARDGSTPALDLLWRAARVPDGSEYVRRTVLGALALADRAGAGRHLARVALQPGLEPCPQVRAQAVLELGRMAVQDPGDAALTALGVRTLARALAADASPLVRRMAMEEVAAVLAGRRPAGSVTPLDALDRVALGALDAVLEDDREPLLLRRAAAAARESILLSTLAAFARLMPSLPALIDTLKDGQEVRLLAGLMDGVDPLEAGRVLAHLSRQDFSLSLGRRGRHWVLRRGEQRDTALWRLLHELTHPSPDKRQAFDHSTGRFLYGELRAPSGILGELTMTKVPGEKVFNDLEGDWRRYLPTVDDYLSLTARALAGRPVRIFSSNGVTTIRGPRSPFGRWRAYLGLSRAYAELASLRAASAGDRPSPTSDRYVRTLERRWGFTTVFEPHSYVYAGRRHEACDPSILRQFLSDARLEEPTSGEAAPAGVSLLPLVLPAWFEPDYFLTRDGNHVNHLAAFSLLLVTWFLGQQWLLYRRLRRARRGLPLVIGGWGTRGKSGSERLKAGLFHGLGYSVFSKTTGCEAMFIHSVPGMPPMELFLFRPYDKATIWEQHHVVRLATALKADVFLWECMALKPDFVFLLQHRWMRDDLSTITNTYPDHEDIQGPAGINIPEVMVNFLGPDHATFTAEDQMLPILRQGARQNGADLRVIDFREVELLTEDLLGRFPYREHPRNIIMVLGMARYLGIDTDFALKEMADHVVPDLGVLKTYPMPGFQPSFRGRTMEFANGMSANERRGTVENWRRMSYDKLDLETDPYTYVVTVVNNRGDRVARSKVFAAVLVNDLPADAHVPIGTNLTGLYGYTMTSLGEKLAGLELIPVPDRASYQPRPLGEEVLDEWRRQMRLNRFRGLSAEVVAEAVPRMLAGAGLTPEAAAALAEKAGVLEAIRQSKATLAGLDAPGDQVASSPELTRALEVLKEGLAAAPDPGVAEEVLRFFETDARRHRSVSNFAGFLRARGVGSGEPVPLAAVEAVNDAYRQLYRGLFREKMRVLHEVHASGDQVIDFVLRQVPPGMHVKIMGIQNIKGTGLGFVYRWISLDKVCGAARRLSHRSEAVRRQAVEELTYYGEYGVLDAPIALEAIRKARRAPANQTPSLQGLMDLAEERIVNENQRALEALAQGHTRTVFSGLVEWVERMIDFLDSRGRRRRADQVFEDLVAGRIAHERAVLELRDLTYRQKGGWLEKALRKRFGRRSP